MSIFKTGYSLETNTHNLVSVLKLCLLFVKPCRRIFEPLASPMGSQQISFGWVLKDLKGAQTLRYAKCQPSSSLLYRVRVQNSSKFEPSRSSLRPTGLQRAEVLHKWAPKHPPKGNLAAPQWTGRSLKKWFKYFNIFFKLIFSWGSNIKKLN